MYNLGIFFYKTAIQIAAYFNPKARQWLDGRKNIFSTIEKSLNAKNKDVKTKTIWLHVASLGEFEQGRPIIEELKKETPQYKIILTFFSPSGYEIRKDYPLADHIFYLPLDTQKNAQIFLDLVQPDMAIFVKYEFWFHYLNELKNRHIPTLLVSGIFREKQFAKGRFFTPIFRKMLGCFTHFFVQDTPSVILLKNAYFHNVTLAGDTRIDRVKAIANEGKTFPIIEDFIGSKPTFIGGSTWQPDEEIIVKLLQNDAFKNWKIILAPHDISSKNIERIEKLLNFHSIRYSKLQNTEGSSSPLTNHKSPITHRESPITNHPSPILIVDNIGMLSSLYRYGKVAYIGGGFGSGIHNTLEPIAHGLPVIFGPKYHKFAEAVQLLETGGAFCVKNSEDLGKIMSLLSDENGYQKAQFAARNYVEENVGATDKICTFIDQYFNQKT